jgi:putative tryptophan/tyrosine transport system substrate-binding protein
MRRRDFIKSACGSVIAWPFNAQAQSSRAVKRISVMMGLAEGDAEAQARIKAFRQGLQQLGWTEGGNVLLEYNYGASGHTRSRELAVDAVRKNPDVILTNSPTALAAVKQATSTIAVVFVQVADPVSDGFVTNLARPGGNITGFAISEHTMCGKWMETLKEIAPGTKRVGFVQHLEHPSWARYNAVIKEVAPAVGFDFHPIGVRSVADVEEGIARFSQQPNSALLVLPDTFNTTNRKNIIGLARQHNLPAIYPSNFFAVDGGLLSYGGDLVDLLRRAASYVDRIFRGANAGDLPVQQATKFELIINLKTARTLGLNVSPMLLTRADRVIE